MTQKTVLAFEAPVTPGRPYGGVILWDESEQSEILEVRSKDNPPTLTTLRKALQQAPGFEHSWPTIEFVDQPNTDPRTAAWFGIMPAEAPSDSARMMGLPITTHKCADCRARNVCAINKVVGDLGVLLEVSECSSYC